MCLYQSVAVTVQLNCCWHCKHNSAVQILHRVFIWLCSVCPPVITKRREVVIWESSRLRCLKCASVSWPQTCSVVDICTMCGSGGWIISNSKLNQVAQNVTITMRINDCLGNHYCIIVLKTSADRSLGQTIASQIKNLSPWNPPMGSHLFAGRRINSCAIT